MAVDTTTQVTMPAMGESVTEGTVLEWHKQEGDPVEVDDVLVEISTDKVDAEAPAEAEIVDITTPAGGESVTEGTILEWAVKVGDSVEDGQTVVEISTDKVDMELPAPASGTITEILAGEGDTVTVGQVIARMALGDGAAPAAAPTPAAPPRERAPGEFAQATSEALPKDVAVSPVAAR